MKKQFAGLATLLCLIFIFAGLHLAQIPADQAITRPDHLSVAGDLGTCNEGETEYNMLTHVGKRCTAANAWATIATALAPAANQVYLVNASGVNTSGTIADLNLTSNTAIGITAQRVCHATYSFAVDGGATPVVPASNCTLPNKAVVTNVAIQSTTAVTASGAATVAIGCVGGTACGASSLMAATAKTSLGTGVFGQSIPVPQTASTWVETTAAGGLTLTIATGPLTAGIIEIYVFYYVSAS